jgi:hypothetical protein
MNRKYQSFIASLVLLVLFGVMTGCRETPINNNPVPRGSQFVGEINGVVRDGNTGAPLSGVTLRLIGPDGDLSTTTNADGIYIFRNLQAGVYKIAAVAPAGYAATRTQDGIELRQQPNQSTGVAVVRVARDFRFFTANASLSGTLQYQTPGGQLLPVPAGTPVFVNFVKDTEPGREVTVGDVQVTLVRDSVRAGGAVSISGLPAVGALSQAGETPFFIVPVFTVGGVTYGDPNTGKALNYAIAGLRPGVTFALPPAATTITSTAATLPLSLSATNMNSRTNFGTTDTIFVAFNKPINTFSFSLSRTQTPYGIAPSSIASTAAGSLIATVLPAGAVPQLGGLIVGANQAFAIRLNRPFMTGSEHRLDINVTATDGTTLSLVGTTGAVGARTFTTVPGIRLLSVTAGGATPVTLSPTTTTVGVPTSGTITFTFDRPPVGPYFTRGPLRNVRFASGSSDPGLGSDELGRVGIQGETNRIDCVGVITGNSLSFGYRSLVGPTPNAAVGTIYQIHASLVNLGPADQPISTNAVAPGTLGNFRSAIPGDFGVVAVLSNRASEFSSFRAFTAAVRNINIPRIVSAAVPANPGDSVRITFTRPMNLSVGQRFNALSDNIRMFRTGGTAPQPYGLSTGTAIRLRISSTSSSGDTTTYFLVRDERRDVDGAAIPFEGNTAYTLEISANLTSSDGVRLGGDLATPAVFTFSGRTAGQQFAGATVGGVAIAGANTRVPTSGNIELRFSRPIRQDVDYRTRGLGQNFELVRISAVGNPSIPTSPGSGRTDSLGPNPTTIFIDATGTKTTDAITFGYRGLHRNTRYALRAISPPAADFFSTTVTLAQIPEAFYNVRWADFPNDPGVGFRTTATEYNDTTGTRLDVRFVTQEAEPARLIASNTNDNPTAFPLVIDSTVQTSLTNPIRLTFSKEMERNSGGAFTLTRVASPYGLSGTVSLKATWNADGTVVSLVPNINVNGDTARTLEAGTTYELTISGLNAVDGGALVPLIRPITFTTQPEIRLVDVKVNNQSFSTTPGLPINAGDTVGTITLTFSKNIGGRYNVRGPLRRFVIIEDSSGTDLSTIDATATSNGTAASVTDTAAAALVDSLSVVNNNTLTIGYRISRQRLRGRLVINNPNGPAVPQNQNRIIRFSLISTSFGGPDYNNLNTVPNPLNIRGQVRGDLGVRGKALPLLPRVTDYTPSADFVTLPRPTSQLEPDKYLNDKPSFTRFGPGNVGVTEFAFYFSTGGTPTSQSFPDLVISSVRNAAESVSQAAKQTVSTVRGWWKRFRGE